MRCKCRACRYLLVSLLCTKIGMKTKPGDTCAFSEAWWEQYYRPGAAPLPWDARRAYLKTEAEGRGKRTSRPDFEDREAD